MGARGLKSAPVGLRVRMTGYFLRATGQHKGPDGASRWLVVACDCGLCSRGEICAVNEPAYDYGQWDDIPVDQRPKWRHIALANLEAVGKLPRAVDLADQVKP